MDVLISQMAAGVAANPIPVTASQNCSIGGWPVPRCFGTDRHGLRQRDLRHAERSSGHLSLSDDDVDAVNSWVKHQFILVMEPKH